MIKVKIRDEAMVLEEAQEAAGTWQQDWDRMVPRAVEAGEPCYLLYRLDEKSGNTYFWILISWSPDDSKVRQKMLYASSKATLKKEFGGGQIKDDLYGNVKVSSVLAMLPTIVICNLSSSLILSGGHNVRRVLAPRGVRLRARAALQGGDREGGGEEGGKQRGRGRGHQAPDHERAALPHDEGGGARRGRAPRAAPGLRAAEHRRRRGDHPPGGAGVRCQGRGRAGDARGRGGEDAGGQAEVPRVRLQVHARGGREGQHRSVVGEGQRDLFFSSACRLDFSSLCSFAVFIYTMPGHSSSIKEKMLYSSCKNGFVDTLQQKGIEIAKKVSLETKTERERESQ